MADHSFSHSHTRYDVRSSVGAGRDVMEAVLIVGLIVTLAAQIAVGLAVWLGR